MKGKSLFLTFLLVVTALSLIFFFSFRAYSRTKAQTSCPSLSLIKKRIGSLGKGITLLRVKKIQVPGLCEVVVKLPNNRKSLFYVDSSGTYLILGRIIDLVKRKDLTNPELRLLNKITFTPSMLKELDKYVAFSYGHSPKVVYMITDPQCPFCKMAEKYLKKLADEGKVTIKVVLFPLEQIHPGSTKKAVSLICDKKGFTELMKGYSSANQCEAGKEKVKKTVKFLREHGISATPTFIFPNGEVEEGLSKRVINKIKNEK